VPNVPVKIDFSCATLTVPLDHGLLPGLRSDGQLSLKVSLANNADAPRGVLVWLVGGPGEPGVSLTADITSGFDPAVLRDYRLVFVSGRGTGDGALQCPELQRAVGDSDFAVPPPGAVPDCGRTIGEDRPLFSTADTVADLETLRQALGVDKLSLDGASYGSFVAERYAMTYPDQVSRLVLDSVVPHDGFDLMNLAGLARTAVVLRMACQETGCTTDPAADLAEVVRTHHHGPELLDTISGLSSGKPDLGGVPAALHQAVSGDFTAIDVMIAAGRRDAATPAGHLSQGLHATAICQDIPGPWGDAATPVAGRAEAVSAAARALPDAAFFPFDRDTATGNGQVVTCEQWPTTPVVPFTRGHNLPPVPVLVLAGDHDLNTPLADAQNEVARAPQGQLAIIPGSGHITQDHANGPGGRIAVRQFLTGL
jgi:pimeloyl-ACP methyl ester carboxylesterase